MAISCNGSSFQDRTSFTGTQRWGAMGGCANHSYRMFVGYNMLIQLKPMTTGNIALETAIFAVIKIPIFFNCSELFLSKRNRQFLSCLTICSRNSRFNCRFNVAISSANRLALVTQDRLSRTYHFSHLESQNNAYATKMPSTLQR